MDSSKELFKAMLSSELKATCDVIKSLPDTQLAYQPHPHSRTAYQLVEHLIAHAKDFNVILTSNICEECIHAPFENLSNAAELLEVNWNMALQKLEEISEDDFNSISVDLLVLGNHVLSMPRANMMWFFLFDVIHHRGQLTTYIRPMGGKNPAVYGSSYDTENT